MKTTLPRILLITLAALLVFSMAGCKSESSPTSPPNTSTVPPGGGVTPPAGATITLSVSNPTPLVSSSVVVTATVTSGGQPVPDGTAVQFTTTGGIFTDTGLNNTIRTTTGGVAKATLTSSTAATDTITAAVNNASKTIQVTFTTQPTPIIPPSTAPIISTVCLANQAGCVTIGLPTGGQQLVITGKNFRAPVKVIFDPGNGQAPKEGFPVSVTDTQIIVVTPAFDITTGQQLPVTITVIDEAGTTNEQSVSKAAAFTYQLTILTPVVRTLSPTSGPIDGGTRIAIIGDGFQAPVQVFFGSAEAQVLKVTFNQIDVMSPTARDTSPDGSAAVTGPVDIKVRNVGSGKEVTFPAGFRYIAKMVITAVHPLSGPSTGGTDVTIDGVGFTDPVVVTVAGFQAQPIRVSGTQILVRTTSTGAPCGSATGPVTVTNVDNGDFFSSTSMGIPATFAYIPILPLITNVSPTAVALGGSVNVTVQNPGIGPLGNAIITFKVNDVQTTATPQQITNGLGAQVFSVVVPSTLTFPTVSCTATTGSGNPITGTQLGPIIASLTFTNITTGCTATLPNAFTINAPTTNPCVTPPVALVTNPTPPNCAIAPSAKVGTTSTTTITIKNDAPANGQTLVIGSATIGGANAADFTIAPPPPVSVPATTTTNFTVSFTPSALGARSGTVTFTTNDPAHPTVTVCLQGTGTP